MDIRLLVSRLSSAQTRTSAARALGWLCAAGAVLTILALAAAGRGLRPWLFVVLVWALFVYIPLRILLETAQTFGPALRRRLGASAERQPGQYTSGPGIELAVERLFEREVVMPRIATPREVGKVREGAAAVLVRTGTDDGRLRAAAGDCLAAVDRWVTSIGGWAARDAGQNIQARWGAVRALAAMAGMTKILLAASRERSGPLAAGNGPVADPSGFLDDCLDYCDELALQVDVPAWPAPPLELPLAEGRAVRLREAWTAYAQTGAPALESRDVFLEALLNPSSRPAPPTAS